MATQDYAASVQGVAVRVTNLNEDGSLKTGDRDSIVTSAFVRVSFTPEFEEGDEITEKSANGRLCVSYKAPDTLKRVTFEVAICEPDPELTWALSGGTTLLDADGLAAGWTSPSVFEEAVPDGVAIEVWSRAVQNGKTAASNPYYHWIFPYVKTRISGDRVIENGMLATTFQGWGVGNAGFGVGPDGRWVWPDVTDRPYSYARSSWAPTGLRGLYTWDPETGDSTAITDIEALNDDPDTLTDDLYQAETP